MIGEKMTSKVKKRRRDIAHILQNESVVYVSEMAKLFKVTKETIRSDFSSLTEEYGYVRIHGGIKQAEEDGRETNYVFQKSKQSHVEEKKQICFRAVDLVHDSSCIYVDGGSTVSYLLNYMGRCKNVTLVTPSIAILMKYILEGYEELFSEKGHELIFIGGKVNTGILTTYGTFFDQVVEEYVFSHMFLSFDGVDMEKGCSNADEIAYALVKKVKKQAVKKIVLADRSKFNNVRPYKALQWIDVDYLVTEKELDSHWMDCLNENKVIYYRA